MVECMQRGSTDNMSAIAVLFDHKSQAHLPTYLKHQGAYFHAIGIKQVGKFTRHT